MIAAQESMTAKLCSFARAYHSMLGKNKIFDDYLAYDIIGKDEYDRIENELSEKYQQLRAYYQQQQNELVSLEDARKNKQNLF